MTNRPSRSETEFSMRSGGHATPAMIHSLLTARRAEPTTVVAERMEKLGLVPKGATVNDHGRIIYPAGSRGDLAVKAPFLNLGLAGGNGTYNSMANGGPHDPAVEAMIQRELDGRARERLRLGLNDDGIPLSFFETATGEVPAAIAARAGINLGQKVGEEVDA